MVEAAKEHMVWARPVECYCVGASVRIPGWVVR